MSQYLGTLEFWFTKSLSSEALRFNQAFLISDQRAYITIFRNVGVLIYKKSQLCFRTLSRYEVSPPSHIYFAVTSYCKTIGWVQTPRWLKFSLLLLSSSFASIASHRTRQTDWEACGFLMLSVLTKWHNLLRLVWSPCSSLSRQEIVTITMSTPFTSWTCIKETCTCQDSIFSWETPSIMWYQEYWHSCLLF